MYGVRSHDFKQIFPELNLMNRNSFPKTTMGLALAIGIPSLSIIGGIYVWKRYFAVSTVHDKTCLDINLYESKTNIAVAGCGGCGKSCLINALRSVDTLDKSAALMNSISDTIRNQMMPYPDPNNDSLIYWELPDDGILIKYIEKLNKFDCLIMLNANRFTKMDIKLIEEAQKLDIPTIVVRSKTDVDINDGIVQQHDSDIDEIKSSLKYMITENVTNELLSADLKPEKVYLVSSLVFTETLDSSKYGIDENDLVDFINDFISSDNESDV